MSAPQRAAAVTPIRRSDPPVVQPAPLLREVYGRLLRRGRQEQGRTLADVSRAAGVSLPYLSELERGLKEPSSEVLEAVCGALGGGVADLVGAAHRELTATSAVPVAPLRPTGDRHPTGDRRPAEAPPRPGRALLLAG